jgi:ureidoglycolate lyase
MSKVKIEKLTMEAFAPFGYFDNFIDPEVEKFGTPPIEFFRDQMQMHMPPRQSISYSTCRVEARPYVIDVSEYHSSTGEGNLPLDNDILIHVAPAVPGGAPFPSNKVRVFRVPQGTLVYIKPGVWHHAPLTVNDKPANVLIILPERTYADDCIVEKLHNPIEIDYQV